jgi:hypothetical protein
MSDACFVRMPANGRLLKDSSRGAPRTVHNSRCRSWPTAFHAGSNRALRERGRISTGQGRR